MSGITRPVECSLASARNRYDNEKYEGCSYCEHLMDEETGTFLLGDETTVSVTREVDCFGPGEVSVLCMACAAVAEAYDLANRTCDFCGNAGTEDSPIFGAKCIDSSDWYDWCETCSFKHRKAFQYDE